MYMYMYILIINFKVSEEDACVKLCRVLFLLRQVYTTAQHFGEVPVQTRCPNCNNDVITHLEYEPGMLTWLIVILLCVLGLWM